ncbi:MAG TPA: peroxiredoxin [Bryobacteraceae bacterium]|nr:peroxiredoxin [Bryobacteraceae bacterium]
MALEWFGNPLPVGTMAPDFTLPDQQGNQVSLAGLRGKNVVLIFYPGDETPGCRKQLCEFRDSWQAVAGKNTVIFGVNPQNANSHAKFQQNHKLPFPLLVDSGQKVGAQYLTSGLIVRRTVYLIGTDGTIRFSRRGTPTPSEVLAAAG